MCIILRHIIDFCILYTLTEFCHVFTEDIAVDWVSNKLYWTETLFRRIEVLDLDTNVIVPIVEADAHSGIRGIAVDPATRLAMYTTTCYNLQYDLY